MSMSVLAATILVLCCAERPVIDAVGAYEAACRLTAERFFDPDMNGVDWSAACAERRERAASAASSAVSGMSLAVLMIMNRAPCLFGAWG